MQASKTLSAYVYASSGISESTSDILFSGHAMIAEPDGTFVENERFKFESNILIQDVDIQRIKNDRQKENSYSKVNFNFEFKEVSAHFINICFFSSPDLLEIFIAHSSNFFCASSNPLQYPSIIT